MKFITTRPWLLTLVVLGGINACSIPCDPPKKESYNIEEYHLNETPSQNNQTVRWSDYTLIIDSKTDWFHANYFQFSLFNSAYASTVCKDAYTSAERLVGFSIYSDHDFSDELPVGSDLSPVFDAAIIGRWLTTELNIAASDLILFTEKIYNDGSFNTVQHNRDAPRQIKLSLNQAPTYPNHSLTILIELDNGDNYELRSKPVSFIIEP